MMWKDLPTPCYVADEKKLKENLRILQKLEKDTGCHVLLAQKAFSMFSLYPMIGTFISGTTASGLYEARLGREEMGKENHVFAPAYKEADMKELVKICDHIVFNSFRQYEKYKELCKQSAQIREDGKPVSVGIRVNPECSTQEGHEIYDPCGPGSRLGVTKAEFREDLLEGVEGLHFHTLCEQDADDLVITFRAFEAKFGKYLKKMKWLNLGGGHHITRPGYQLKQLKQLIAYIRATYQVSISGTRRGYSFKCRISGDRSAGYREKWKFWMPELSNGMGDPLCVRMRLCIYRMYWKWEKNKTLHRPVIQHDLS